MKLFFSIVFTLITASLNAQLTDSLSVDIDEVVISENRIDIPFSDASRYIEIINQTDIEKIQAQSINEVLQTIGGIDVRQRGMHGVQADLSIRGGTFEQSLVLINGIKMLDPQTGHHLMNLPITLADIDRIEVLKGPGARVFGQNAFAGAINIITKTQTEFSVAAGLDYGDHGLINAFTSVNIPSEKINQKVSFSYNHSDGYRDNTDYNITNLFYQGQVDVTSNQLEIMAGHTARNFGANGFYGSLDFTDQYEETRTTFISSSYEARVGDWKISPRLHWRHNKDNWQFRRQDPEFFQNFHTSDVITGELNVSRTHALGILGIGAEYNAINLTSNNLGDRERGQLGFHLENRFLLLDEQLDITPGLYVLSTSDFGTELFPGLDIGYRLDNNWKLFSNFGRTSRIPSFTDLYYEDRGNLGNPNLQTESAFTYELGGKYKRGQSVFQISYFRRDASDLIDWFKVNPDDEKWMPDNFGSATYNGIDLSATFAFDGRGKKNSFLQSLRANYLFLDAALGDSDVASSRNALENLKHQLVIHPRFRITKDLHFNILYKYNDRVSIEDYSIIDANVQYELGPLTISLKASNLLDATYRETSLVPMPGRWMMVGLRYRF